MDDFIRQRAGLLTPSEQLDKEYKDQAISFYKEQRELVADQKEYTKTIRFATIVTAAATVVMGIAMVVQVILMYKSPLQQAIIAAC